MVRTTMYICICKNVTDHQIRKAVYEQDVNNVRQLRACLGACDQCGKCVRDAMEVIRGASSEKTATRGHRALAS